LPPIPEESGIKESVYSKERKNVYCNHGEVWNLHKPAVSVSQKVGSLRLWGIGKSMISLLKKILLSKCPVWVL
jgi:hypothetical protein